MIRNFKLQGYFSKVVKQSVGIFSNIMGITPPEKPPTLTSIFPPAAAQRIRAGKLPTIQVDKLILEGGEVCRFVDVAAMMTIKKRYRTSRAGGSYRITKGFTFHLGNSETTSTSEPEYTKGLLYITDYRIVFVSNRNGFDQKLKKLTAVTPYSDALSFQFGGKSYPVLLPDPDTANLVINLLI